MNIHDFPSDATAKAVPYGIYDLATKRGHVYIGTSAETADFAVDAIVRWWTDEGRATYPHAKRLLLLADSGGPNGCRVRLWKERLQRLLVDVHGIEVTVGHYPTGCSKWNPIEHLLFGPISTNWAGIPLRTLDRMLALIRGTRSDGGLTVKADLLEGAYRTGRKISDKLFGHLSIKPHVICPKWNYTLSPRQLSAPSGISGFQHLMPWDLIELVS